MSMLYVIWSGLGLSAVLLVLAVRQYVRKAKRVEVLEHENADLRKALEQQKETTEIFSRPRGSKSDVVDRL